MKNNYREVALKLAKSKKDLNIRTLEIQIELHKAEKAGYQECMDKSIEFAENYQGIEKTESTEKEE